MSGDVTDKAPVKDKAPSKVWIKNPDAEITRVFRVLRPPTKKTIMTLMQKKRVIDGYELDELVARLQPNVAQQYVLQEGAIEYNKQLRALRVHEKRGFIQEIDPEKINIPWIPPEQVKLAEAEALVKKLKALV